ncbi:MAG: hypothetical protein H6R15_1520 [Proteobacteria bacterium]|nr:hypothetical protein [Pseudomonadota bacterium]
MKPSTLQDAGRAGLYHLSVAGQPRLAEMATEARFELLTADLGTAHGLTASLGELGKVLGFPAWYGTNLDALHDCLTDPDWYPERGVVILINGLEALRQHDPEAFSTLLAVLGSAARARSASQSPLWILLSTTARGVASLPDA